MSEFKIGDIVELIRNDEMNAPIEAKGKVIKVVGTEICVHWLGGRKETYSWFASRFKLANINWRERIEK